MSPAEKKAREYAQSKKRVVGTQNETDAAMDFKQGAKWAIHESFKIANSYAPFTEDAFNISAEIKALIDE